MSKVMCVVIKIQPGHEDVIRLTSHNDEFVWGGETFSSARFRIIQPTIAEPMPKILVKDSVAEVADVLRRVCGEAHIHAIATFILIDTKNACGPERVSANRTCWLRWEPHDPATMMPVEMPAVI